MTCPTPLLRKRIILAAKIETTVGTAIALSASDAQFNIFEHSVNPQIEFEERAGQGVFSPLPGVLGARGAQISFFTELTGRGSSGAAVPKWASTFLPACGLVDDTTGQFQLKSRPPGVDGVKTLTIGVYEDGLYKQIHGAMGNAVFNFVSGKIVRVNFTFMGVWDAPTDVALIAPTYPTVQPQRFASAAIVIGGSGGWSPILSEMSIDLGNQLVMREDANDASGYCTALITGRRCRGTMNPETRLVAGEDTYGKWLSLTERALALQIGSGVNRVDFAAPKFQVVNPQEGERNGLQIDQIEFQLNRSASAGDDELTIDFN
jgi:hypothetical protein